MKLILITLVLLFLAKSSYSQNDLGLGIITVSFDEKTVLNLFSNPQDKNPSQQIKFYLNKSTKSVDIQNIEQSNAWLAPEFMKLDYDLLIFRCKTITDN
jgi:hypothetical protein